MAWCAPSTGFLGCGVGMLAFSVSGMKKEHEPFTRRQEIRFCQLKDSLTGLCWLHQTDSCCLSCEQAWSGYLQTISTGLHVHLENAFLTAS